MLSRSAIHRIACAAVAGEVKRQRGAYSAPLPYGEWSESLPLGNDGLGFDSLERLGVISVLAETFNLDSATLDAQQPECVKALIDWIERGRDHAAGSITVMTSGSTGTARAYTHAVTDLLHEAGYFATLLPERRRIVAMVPAHHLYGLIWTALLPDSLGVPVVAQHIGGKLDLQSGDLLVAVPEQWQAILRLSRHFPADLYGVSSAGYLDQSLGQNLLDAGIARIIDVYGCSEAGAIATRDVPAMCYDLLPRWQLAPAGEDWVVSNSQGRQILLPDKIERIAARSLRPIGRNDGAVQIAGHNVWPTRVAAALEHITGVAELTVRLGANGRLKAFIVPEAGADVKELARVLERTAIEKLSDAERPKVFTFGTALPRNEMGKLTDWAS